MEVRRRSFLAGAAGMVGAALAETDEKNGDGGYAPVSWPGDPARERPVLPAGAVSIRRFARHCVGCQLCVAACPHGVLRPSMRPGSFAQVEMSFVRGWCRPECDACAKACPAGAILPVTPEEKRHTHAGLATWDRTRCLAATEGVTCTACERHCPSGAITLVARDPKNPKSPKVPQVDAAKCLGCGACEHLCPARPLPAMTVKGYEVQHAIRPMSDADLLAEARRLVESDQAACVLAKDGVIVAVEKGRGVAPLLDLLDHAPEKLRGAWVIDKVIGRAAAAICIVGGAARVYALLGAEGARPLLAAKGIPFAADKLVPLILNRTKTGSCPLEASVKDLSDPPAMLVALRRRVAELKAAAAKTAP